MTIRFRFMANLFLWREPRRVRDGERIGFELLLLQLMQPAGDQLTHRCKVQSLVRRRVFLKICPRQLEQRGGGTQMVPLKMHKRPGELNQPLVKTSVYAVPILEPEMFENLVRLEIFPPVEQLEITGVMRVERSVPELTGHRGDAFSFVAHTRKVKSNVQSLKSKVAA